MDKEKANQPVTQTPKSTISLFGTKLDVQTDPRLIKWGGVLALELIVIVMVFVVMLMPQITKLQKMQKDLAAEKKIVLDLVNKTELIESFGLNVLSSYPFILSDVVFTQKQVGVFISSLSQLATRAGVEVVSYSAKPGEIYSTATGGQEAVGKANQSFEVSVVVSGEAQKTMEFLRLVNASIPLKKITDIGIKSSEGTEGSFELELKVEGYYISDNKQVDLKAILSPISDEDMALASQLQSYIKFQNQVLETNQVEVGNENLFGL